MLQIRLENFAGPLDLLLHLIRRQEMDICDIRIFEITEQYLAIIDRMKQLDLDVAGEFLLMAAQLIHIKSRMLLPVSDEAGDEEEEDPRAELVKRLLEYQRYKQAGQLFDQLPQLGRDIFPSGSREVARLAEQGSDEAELTVSVYQLANAFHLLLQSVKPEIFHEVISERLSVADAVAEICRQLLQRSRLGFAELFDPAAGRAQLVVTFLALLELVKLRMVRIEQVATFSDIWLSAVAPAEQLQRLRVGDEVLDYD